MPSLFDWSSTAASNTTVDGININTGMSPGNVDNALRSIMALVRGTFSASLQNFLAGTAGVPVASGGTGATDAAGARNNLGIGSAATLPETTAAQIRSNAAGKLISTDKAWAAAAFVSLTSAATITPDFSAGINFNLTLATNATLATPTNMKEGQAGLILITQDATGGRTLGYQAGWLFAGGLDPVLSTAAGAKDGLFYQVLPGGTAVFGTLVKGLA